MILSRRPPSPKRQGGAIVMVVVFLAIIGLIAITVSYQSSFVRRTTTRSHYGFEAVEICESAINEAHSQVQQEDVFVSPLFDNMDAFCRKIADNKISELEGAYPGYKFKTRDLRDAAGAPTGQKLFVAMIWPDDKRPTKANKLQGFLRKFQTPATRENAQTLFGFKGLSDVKFSVLSWRRDFVGGVWQTWGVMHYEVTCNFDDGKQHVTRTMHVDRMFSLYAHTPPIDPHDLPDDPAAKAAEAGLGPQDIAVHFILSRSNLKTVILRS